MEYKTEGRADMISLLSLIFQWENISEKLS